MTPMQMILSGIRNMGLGKSGGKSSWGKGSQPNKGGGKGNQVCYKCGKTGHIARDCPQSTGTETRRCRKCGKLGHLEKDCRSAIAAREVEEEEEKNQSTGEPVWLTNAMSPMQSKQQKEPQKSVQQLIMQGS